MKFDAAVDYGLAPQVSHIGAAAVTCCLDSVGTGVVFYLANPQPTTVDPRTGRPKPPQGELHIAQDGGQRRAHVVRSDRQEIVAQPDSLGRLVEQAGVVDRGSSPRRELAEER